MNFAKIAFAQRILRMAMEKQAMPPLVSLAGKAIAGSGKAIAKGAWGLAGVGARGMGATGPIAQPIVRAGILGMGALGTAAAVKEGKNFAQASFHGFDPNVQGASRVRTNPQYSYQEQ